MGGMHAAQAGGTAAGVASAHSFWLRGTTVSGLNPKALLLMFWIVPQFTRPAAEWPLTLQLAVLGFSFVGMAALSYLVMGFSAQKLLVGRPTVARVSSLAAGVVMVLLGVSMYVEKGVELLA